MQRCIAQHTTSGETFILATDERDYVHGSIVLHWSDWRQADSGTGPHGTAALREDINLFSADLDDDSEPYYDGGEWSYIACQADADAPIVDLRYPTTEDQP